MVLSYGFAAVESAHTDLVHACTGAVLIRNLPVSSTAEVADMVAAAQEADACRSQSSWTNMPYVPFGAPRDEQDGIMMCGSDLTFRFVFILIFRLDFVFLSD